MPVSFHCAAIVLWACFDTTVSPSRLRGASTGFESILANIEEDVRDSRQVLDQWRDYGQPHLSESYQSGRPPSYEDSGERVRTQADLLAADEKNAADAIASDRVQFAQLHQRIVALQIEQALHEHDDPTRVQSALDEQQALEQQQVALQTRMDQAATFADDARSHRQVLLQQASRNNISEELAKVMQHVRRSEELQTHLQQELEQQRQSNQKKQTLASIQDQIAADQQRWQVEQRSREASAMAAVQAQRAAETERSAQVSRLVQMLSDTGTMPQSAMMSSLTQPRLASPLEQAVSYMQPGSAFLPMVQQSELPLNAPSQQLLPDPRAQGSTMQYPSSLVGWPPQQAGVARSDASSWLPTSTWPIGPAAQSDSFSWLR